MNLRLIREPTSPEGATLGILCVNGVFECWTLEDAVREAKVVPGGTAIPAGRYKVIVTESLRFQRRLPLLLSVPGFTGIRIHAGNTTADTEGCILPGTTRVPNMVKNSRVAFQRLFERIEAALAQGEAVWIEIENSKG